MEIPLRAATEGTVGCPHVGVPLVKLQALVHKISKLCRCETCSGIGLVKNSRGTALLKCSDCGGFFPWLGWKTFFTSTASPGNGGPLRAPKVQTSVFYKVLPKPSKTLDSPTETQPPSAPDASSCASVEEPTGVGKS